MSWTISSRTLALLVLFIFSNIISGCTTLGPVLSKGDQRFYETNTDRSLLLVQEEGKVFDVSCLGLKWAKTQLGKTLTRSETCEGHSIKYLGKVGWDPEAKDWNMHGYEISDVCYPIEDKMHQDMKDYKTHARAWSCINRMWEVPFWSTISVVQLIGLFPQYILSLLTGSLNG